MKQLTVRGFEPELADRIRKLADTEGISLNKAIIKILRKGTGLDTDTGTIGDSLDHLIGAWTDEEAEAFNRSIDYFEVVDEEDWQ